MIKPTLILENPYGMEYPRWRHEMVLNQNLFERIIVVFNDDHRQRDYRQFIVSSLPRHVIFLDVQSVQRGDWRDVCIHKALPYVTTPWILFLEQDFVTKEEFYKRVFSEAESYDLASFTEQNVPWQVGSRVHPAFLLVKRESLDKTSKDFGAHPEKEIDRDHFGVVSDELFRQGLRYYDLSEKCHGMWKHYASYYYNYMCVHEGKQPPYKPKEFREIVELNLSAPVPQEPTFVEWSKKCLEMIPYERI